MVHAWATEDGDWLGGFYIHKNMENFESCLD